MVANTKATFVPKGEEKRGGTGLVGGWVGAN